MSLHHSMKLIPGIRPKTGFTSVFLKTKYRLMLNNMYETIRKINTLTISNFDRGKDNLKLEREAMLCQYLHVHYILSMGIRR